MDKELASKALDQILGRQLSGTTRLIDTLKHEKAVLTSDPEAVERLAEEKRQLVSQLEELHHESNSLLQQTGYAGDSDGMQAFLAWCDDSEQTLHKHWQHLLENIESCRRLNQINGMVVEKSTQTLRHALAILSGQTVTDISYDASGARISDNDGRALAKA